METVIASVDAGENRLRRSHAHRAAIGIERAAGGVAVHALGRTERAGQGGDIQAAGGVGGDATACPWTAATA